MARYPTYIVSWSSIATTGTVLRASHVTDVIAEIEAIQSEIGLTAHGVAGSIAERLDTCSLRNGTLIGRVYSATASATQRQQTRSGYYEHTILTTNVSENVTITYEKAIGTNASLSVTGFATILVLDSTNGPHFVSVNSASYDSMSVVLQRSSGNLIAGAKVGIYWFAISELTTPTTTATDP